MFSWHLSSYWSPWVSEKLVRDCSAENFLSTVITCAVNVSILKPQFSLSPLALTQIWDVCNLRKYGDITGQNCKSPQRRIPKRPQTVRVEEEEVRESRPAFGSYLWACINGPDWNIMPVSLFSTVTKTNLAVAICAMKRSQAWAIFSHSVFHLALMYFKCVAVWQQIYCQVKQDLCLYCICIVTRT